MGRPRGRKRWTAVPRQDGRTVVVTGASSGIGLQTARILAAFGAHVVLAVRNTEKGETVARRLPGSTQVRRLDVADLASVRAFAEETGRVDVLVNNAGIMAVPFARTNDGFESQLATNHLGHFALTNLLLPKLTDRVVVVASAAHKSGRIDLDDLNWERRPYRPYAAYGQSKLANLMFAYELQHRLLAAGSTVRSMAAHPGYASTNLMGRTGTFQDGFATVFTRAVAQSAEMGALPELYAATVADLPGGSYIGPGGPGEMRGYPRPVGSTGASHDRVVQRELWTASEHLTGVHFSV
jgi:NAD(P)-dependent dehydrogenase (short-subunit alcohol dehydrogenase family)